MLVFVTVIHISILVYNHALNDMSLFALLMIFYALPQLDLLAHINIMIIFIEQLALFISDLLPLHILQHHHLVQILIEDVVIIVLVLSTQSVKVVFY